MLKRIIQAGLAGMNQDVINPKVNTLYAYEIKNFRINSTGHSNGIELTSEKGTLFIPLYSGGARYNDYNDYYKTGISDQIDESQYEIIGYSVLNDWLVLFITGSYVSNEVEYKDDQILKLQYNEGLFMTQRLYRGDLNFDKDHRIEAIPCYENEYVQKVYWIDGKNYPRVINIAKEGGYMDFDADEDPFSFYQKISFGGYNTIDVTKTYVGGLFYAGVIQYAFSFYNKNALETPIIYTTSLNYISHSDRGEAPNKLLGCAFNVTVKINPEDLNNFEYVRVYSIYRSSINGTPVIKVIKDAKCEDFTNNTTYYSITFTDTNELGYDFDAYRILINSDHVIPNAIACKDQKMFLGNYTSDITVQNPFTDTKDIEISWDNDWDGKQFNLYDQNKTEIYPYINQISTPQNAGGVTIEHNSNLIKTFKWKEYYKFGVLFQDKFGNWSSVYHIETTQNDKYPKINPSWNVRLPYAYTSMSSIYDSLTDDAKEKYVKIRPVVSFPTLSERGRLCQGIVSPTVFNSGMRKNGTCHALSSWFFRPYCESDDYTALTNLGYVEHRHFYPLGNSTNINGELLNMYFDDVNQYISVQRSECTESQFEEGYTDSQGVVHKAFDALEYSSTTYQFTFNNGVDPSITFYTHYIDLILLENDTYIYAAYNITEDDLYDVNNTLIGKKYTVDRYLCDINAIGGVLFTESDFTKILEYDIFYWVDPLCQKEEYTVFEQTDTGIREYTLWDDDINEKYDSFYFVDENTITFNSPDIDFNENLKNVDISLYHAYQVGYINFKNVASKYQIIAESPLFLNDAVIDNNHTEWIRSSRLAMGFYNRGYSCYDDTDPWLLSLMNGRMLSASMRWVDDICNIFTWDGHVHCGWNDKEWQNLYMVYPWQRQHLNNYNGNQYKQYGMSTDSKAGITDESESGKIIKKVLSNMRFCDTEFIDEGDFSTDIIKYVDTTNDAIIKLDDDFFYNGNVDQLVTCSSEYTGIRFVFQRSDSSAGIVWDRGAKTGYPIIIDTRKYTTKTEKWPAYNDMNDIQDGAYARPMNSNTSYSGYKDFTPSDSSSDPIMIRYKSSNHLVMRTDSDTGSLHSISKNYSLPLFDIYKDISNSPYVKDNSDFALQNRIWVPCGDALELSDTGTLRWTEGDTYFQRYDCLKTYPYSNDDYQSVVEIASFMVETHVNLDGRYDENRGLIDNTFVNPTNFNLINPVYSQTNNFFQYNVLDEENFKTTDFPTRFTWSLNKINGLDIDEWTRTNTAAFYDCDGDKGELTSLRRFNGQIYAFQDKGISRIKYNENVAINTQNGTPIELGNSQAVNGVEYLSELVGSQNKWSNISTPNGIFFTDNYTAGLYRLGGGERVLTNLTKNVLQRWFESNNTNHDFINTASYDANMNEIHFMFDNQSLAYNNDFGTFSSFYDYNGWIGNIKNHSFNITGNSIYFLRESNKYNLFYGTKKPYWISFVANSNIDGYSPSDAIYDNVWYKADVLHSTKNDNFNYDELIQNTDDVIPDFSKDTGWYETFNKIVVGNDYQYAENKNQTKNFDFIKKFRTWRVPVPRQDRARMRNSWLRIRLENTKPSYDKMVLRDIYVDSFF